LTPAQVKQAKAGHALVGPDKQLVPYQLINDGDKVRIAFAADLPPFEERRYHFSESAKNAIKTDLTVGENDGYINLRNSLTGISLRRTLKEDQGPIAGMQLADGGWIGDSKLRGPKPAVEYSVQVTAQGPVFAEAICSLKFGDKQSARMTFRVYAHEPVVLIDETFSTGDESALLLALGTDFSPDYVFYRAGNNVVGKNAFWKKDPEDQQPVFVLEPWLHWWERDRQGNWFGLFSSRGDNLISLAALEPGLWIDPAMPQEQRSAAQIFVTQDDHDLWATFPWRGGQRKWMITSLAQDPALDLPPAPPTGRGPGILKVSTLPQRYLVKHGDFPLDRVKETTKPWAEKPGSRVRSLVSEANLVSLKQRFQPSPELLAKCRHRSILEHELDETMACYLVTDDAKLGRHLADEAVRLLQQEVDNFYRQNNSPTLGAEPHRRANSLLPAINLAALMMSLDRLPAEQSQRLKSQLAFLAETVTRPDFYSQARGYSANPNMTSLIAAFQVRLASAIPSHPKSADWIAGGMHELKREMNQWSDDNGGWLEAPHYALVAFDSLLGCFLGAHLAGQDDVLFDPKMKLVAEWLAKMSSPPDVRINGYRHHLPIGNTYQTETSSVYGHMAVLWREKDPKFSAEMQWMHRQCGSPTSPGIGGFNPTLAGFRSLLLDPDLPAAAPQWKSELFPESGVILRSGFPSQRETQLSLIAGRNHDHYDDDSGSITLWGKGSLLANDFGYDGAGSIEDHNLVISPGSRRGVMRVEEFAATERFDTVRGIRDGWTRRIAFVKDTDPLGRNYFVISDTLREPAPMKWQLWLTADEVILKPQAALAKGLDDVDLDVIFAAPSKLALRTEEKSRQCGAGRPDRSFDGGNVVAQTGVIAELPAGNQIIAVLFSRLKDEPTPDVSLLAEGKVIRVHDPDGTDFIFLGPEPFEFQQNDVSFAGTAGVIQLRKNSVVLALGASGRIAARQQELRAESAQFKAWNLKP
jgi:hypothetical protein